MNFYLIHTKDQSCYPEGIGVKNLSKKRDCSECMYVHPDERNSGLDLVVRKRPKKVALNYIYPPSACFVNVEFLSLFSDEINELFNLGKVYLGDGTLLEDYVSFTGKKRTLVRGSEKSFYRICSECNRIRYHADYPWYILESSIPETSITEGWPKQGFVINQELRGRIDKSKWKGIYISKLPVLEEPKDGIKTFPDESQWADW